MTGHGRLDRQADKTAHIISVKCAPGLANEFVLVKRKTYEMNEISLLWDGLFVYLELSEYERDNRFTDLTSQEVSA